jgi:hypothetical protein
MDVLTPYNIPALNFFFPFFFNFFFGRETRIEKRYALSIKSDLELQDYVPKI